MYLALQLTAAQGHADRLARRDRRRVAQHARLLRVPGHGIAAAEHRERAQSVEPRRGIRELRDGVVLMAFHGGEQLSVRPDEARANRSEAPPEIEGGELA